jgi:CRP/FNR family transcriptional regulator
MPLAADVAAAFARSRFSALPPQIIAQLAAASVRLDVAAGTELNAPDEPPRLLLVIAGVGKTYLIASNGRQVTIRYTRPGSIVAVPAVFDAQPEPHPPGVRALTQMAVLVFNMETVRTLASTDVRVANVFNAEMAERMKAYFLELAGTAFASLRERVIRHLLDVASEQQRGPALIARLSQQELADSVASVREVVARVLARLRDDGLVHTSGGNIELLDPVRLAEEAAPGVTKVTHEQDMGH